MDIKQLPFYLTLLFLLACADNNQPEPSYTTWSSYLGDAGRNHYTQLSQITPENVSELEIAWTYKTKDSGQMQMSPIIANGLVYGTSPVNEPFAVDAKTGDEIWSFSPQGKEYRGSHRGVSYWEDGDDKRIFCAIGPYLYALDAMTGVPVAGFGDKGKIDLHSGLPPEAEDKYISSTTPGAIFKDLIIMPIRLSETADAAPGDLRAFSTRTGELMWTFHTIPHPGEVGYDTWKNKDAYKNTTVGGVNNWTGVAVDTLREMVFVPLGSAAPDFYGKDRKGQNLFANSLVALDANTGEYIWHFQFTHHDLWDRDPPAPPNLITLTRNGTSIDAVAQVTKQGYVFVFDRETGKPLFDIEERVFPGSRVEGEEASPTQPIPTRPLPYSRIIDSITADDITPYSQKQDSLREVFNTLKKGEYLPPSTDAQLLLPGYDGGAEWGGAGADPESGILYVNSNEIPWILQLEKTETNANTSAGESLYTQYCAVCHKADRSGNPQSNYPSLLKLHEKLKKAEAKNIIEAGKGMMPGFTFLSDEEVNTLLAYVFEEEQGDKKEVGGSNASLAYRHMGYPKFLDENGLPAIAPPWGRLSAIDLNSGDYLWQIPLGDTMLPGNTEKTNTGTQNYGGPIITQNGLVLIAATEDGFFRAFDKEHGRLLWETRLPAASFTTPATYMIDGKQYIVMACGGEKLGTPKGNQIIAFALPD